MSRQATKQASIHFNTAAVQHARKDLSMQLRTCGNASTQRLKREIGSSHAHQSDAARARGRRREGTYRASSPSRQPIV
eukprot:1752944-Pleurochrysis_carterae.AAC.3